MDGHRISDEHCTKNVTAITCCVCRFLKIAKEYKTIEERIVEAIRNGEDPVEAHERVNYDFLTQTS